MSETNETEGKAARGARKMSLNVRRTVESGHVRQSFSHGRSKSVLVEKKKRRAIGPGGVPRQPPRKRQNPSRRRPRPKRPNRKPRTRKPAAFASCCRNSPRRRRTRGCARSPKRASARRPSARERRKPRPIQVVNEEQRAKERQEADERKRRGRTARGRDQGAQGRRRDRAQAPYQGRGG